MRRYSSTQGILAGKEHLACGNQYRDAHRERDAVLVDTFLSAQQSRELVDWVESGKNRVTNYVTHRHGDHFLSWSSCSIDSHAKAVATAPVVAAARDVAARVPSANRPWSRAVHR